MRIPHHRDYRADSLADEEPKLERLFDHCFQASVVLPANVALVEAEVADATHPGHHDPERLADAAMQVYMQAAGHWAAPPATRGWL